MSRWEDIPSLTVYIKMELSQIQEMYNASEECKNQLSLVHSELSEWVRLHCDEFIRNGKWGDVLSRADDGTREDTKFAEEFSAQLYDELLKVCDKKLNEEQDPKIREDVRATIFQGLQERYKSCPLKLVRTVVNCLHQEDLLWKAFQSQKQCGGTEDMKFPIGAMMDIDNNTDGARDSESLSLKIVHLKGRVDRVEEELEKVKDAQLSYATDMPIILSSINQLQSAMQNLAVSTNDGQDMMSRLQESRNNLTFDLTHSRQVFLTALQESCAKIDEVFPLLSEEVSRWKDRQRDFYLKLEDEPIKELTQLSQWCADLGDKLFVLLLKLGQCQKGWTESMGDEEQVRQQLNAIQNFRNIVKTKFGELIKRSVVETVQPPSIIQVTSNKSSPGTSRSFQAKIRVLALEKIPCPISTEISAELLSEPELNKEVYSKKITLELHNKKSDLEKKRSGVYNLVIAPFDSLQVRQFKRQKRARKTTATGPDQLFVCEQKFRLVFTGNFNIPNYLEDVPLRVVSLPVTITTNSSQESDCSAGSLWQCYNSAADNDHGPYIWPDNVPWPQISAMLNKKMEVETGRGLPKDQLEYLADKLNGGEPNDGNYENLTISWARFAKEKMEGRDFSFWTWFHASMNILKHHMQDEWKDGRIYGFVSKKKLRDVLSNCKVGVCLLRISESIVDEKGPHITGAVSAAFVRQKTKNGKPQKSVNQIDPYTIKELELHGSLGRVLEYTEADMKWLYPGELTIEEAFRNYRSKKGDCRRGSQNDGYSAYIGRTIHFKLDMLTIDDGEPDFEDEPDTSLDDQTTEGGSSGNWSSYAETLTPMSEATLFSPQSVDTFSTGVLSPPVPSPQMQQQQQQQHFVEPMVSKPTSSPVLTELLTSPPLAGNLTAADHILHANMANGFTGPESTLQGNLLNTNLNTLQYLPSNPYQLDENADPDQFTYNPLDDNPLQFGTPTLPEPLLLGGGDVPWGLDEITPTIHN